MIEIQENVPLAEDTTFKIGGPARYLTDAKTEDELLEALQWARARNLPFVIQAGGSNILIPDDGLEALVIRLRSAKSHAEGMDVVADAGCNLLDIIQKASILGLGGWEKLAGIPGTVGGAVRGNAGAFGTEIKDVVKLVHTLNSNTYEKREFTPEECAFAYRMSFFKMHPEWIITRVVLELNKTDPKESVKLCEETIAERENRHLQNVKAAGSYFMNPVAPQHIQDIFEKEKGMKPRGGRVPAGWLIEKASMKGAEVGGAIASVQHPNYIVNTGSATAADVRALAAKIKQAVKIHFNVDLEEEAVVLER